jgi:hypothetical protein
MELPAERDFATQTGVGDGSRSPKSGVDPKKRGTHVVRRRNEILKPTIFKFHKKPIVRSCAQRSAWLIASTYLALLSTLVFIYCDFIKE